MWRGSSERAKFPLGDDGTLAAFVLAQLRELPEPGDHFVWAGWRFEVVDMDDPGIDMVLVQRQTKH
jgi:putative hemolysin